MIATILILTILLVSSTAVVDDTQQGAKSAHFGVLLTTIPQRMPIVHHTISSWLGQSIKPVVICLVVPKQFRRFDRELQLVAQNLSESEASFLAPSSIDGKLSSRDLLRFYLGKTHNAELLSNQVQILESDKDWGPVSKYLGIYEATELRLASPNNIARAVDHWVIGDDDVHYASNLLSRYQKGIDAVKVKSTAVRVATVWTHFAPTARVHYTRNTPMNAHAGDLAAASTNEGPLQIMRSVQERVMHVQGVDTVCLSTETLQSHELLARDMLELLVQYFHNVCPASFYQDDYIISFILHISRLRVVSLWEPHVQVVDHVDEVSKSYDQMHMDTATVHVREQKTKQCIIDFANRIYDIIHLCRTNSAVCDRFREKLNTQSAPIDDGI
jgi:hypothetical protein